MLTISFLYKGNRFMAVVREKYYINGKEYRVTVMNGELERMLFGDHIIKEVDGEIAANPLLGGDKKELQESIVKALKERFSESRIF